MFVRVLRTLTALAVFAVASAAPLAVVNQDAAAPVQSPTQAQSPPPAIQFVAPDSRPALPPIDGLTPDEVREFLGPPFATQVLKDKRLAWSYGTPDGVQVVYFRPEAATGTSGAKPPSPPAKQQPQTQTPAKAQAQNQLPPNGCDGLIARGPVVSLVVVMPKTPAFVTPQMRADAVTTFAPYTTLTSLGTSGAWYLVTFPGARGPQNGYVHCTDVTVLSR